VGDGVGKNWDKMRVELKLILAVFTVEHLLLSIPVLFLTFNIWDRGYKTFKAGNLQNFRNKLECLSMANLSRIV
jgi:hypothetical protein